MKDSQVLIPRTGFRTSADSHLQQIEEVRFRKSCRLRHKQSLVSRFHVLCLFLWTNSARPPFQASLLQLTNTQGIYMTGGGPQCQLKRCLIPPARCYRRRKYLNQVLVKTCEAERCDEEPDGWLLKISAVIVIV